MGPIRHTWDTLLYILLCLLVSGSQRISLCFFVLQGLLILSLPSHTQGCCHCPHLTLQGFDIVALLLTPAPFPAQLHNSPPSAPSSRRETLLCGMNHHLAKLFGLCHSLAQISLYFSWGPIQVHLQTNHLFESALQWHAIFLITHIISLLGKFSLANCPPDPCWCSENRDCPLWINLRIQKMNICALLWILQQHQCSLSY